MHSPTEMKVNGQQDITITVENGGAGCKVTFLAPSNLQITQTGKFDPPPRPRIKLKQWHLQAGTPNRQEHCQFVTIMRPHRKGEAVAMGAEMEKQLAGYACKIALADGEAIVLLRTVEGQPLAGYEAETDGDVAAVRLDASGRIVDSFVTGGAKITYRVQNLR